MEELSVAYLKQSAQQVHDFLGIDRAIAVVERWLDDPARSDAFEIPSAVTHSLSAREPAPIYGGWLVGFAPGFRRAIEGLDKRLQGRVLEALTILSKEPTEPRGNTIKQLTGELKRYWRYRVGNYRLINEPRSGERRVIFLDLRPRGEAYD